MPVARLKNNTDRTLCRKNSRLDAYPPERETVKNTVYAPFPTVFVTVFAPFIFTVLSEKKRLFANFPV